MTGIAARFPFLAQRLFNAPLAVLPHKAGMVAAALAERLGLARPGAIEVAAFDDMEPMGRRGPAAQRGYDIANGVAVIAVQGLLVQRLGTLRPVCGMTGYDGIRANLLTALADPEVRALAFDCDSPGGEVAGCFDLVDTIHAARGLKPIWAICAESAYSAAYAIASAADRVTVPRTGGVGSVGVIAMLVDFSAAIAEAGIRPHFLHYGARKAEEMRAEVLGVTDDLLARLQVEIDAMGELFVATVARNRGLSAAAVRAQQAACFQGEAGVAQGLADQVAAPDAAFLALLNTIR